jgi:hypothetical protein
MKSETCGCDSVWRENENKKGKMILTFSSNPLHVSYKEELTHGGFLEKKGRFSEKRVVSGKSLDST